MHTIEPHYNWRHLYIASDDERSPFYNHEYSEFEFTHSIYDYFIHPQWDEIGSATLYVKILFVNYDKGFCIIELLGEWNDCLYNDIMFLKRNLADILIEQGITKFILIGENVMNFHASDTDYYQEWFDDLEDGWIACVNFREHVAEEFMRSHIDYYLALGGKLEDVIWRSNTPDQVYEKVNSLMIKRLPV
jgi:hypothetical protein